MEVIPVINCQDFKCVKKKIRQIQRLGSAWAHLDVADGVFTHFMTWHKPEDFIADKNRFSLGEFLSKLIGQRTAPAAIKLEIHLMVENPETVLERWLKTGAQRVVVHNEKVADGWVRLLAKCEEYKAELMAAINPETPVGDIISILNRYEIKAVQLLAVKPGPAGQRFNPAIIEKIRILKAAMPNIKLEIDGGMNPETAKLVKEAGADMITSATYIWHSLSHQSAFEELQRV